MFYQQSFQWRFLLPGYWFTWLGLVLLWLINLLPLSFKRKLSKGLGSLVYHYNVKRRSIVETNLSWVFPQKDLQLRQQMARDFFSQAVFVLLDYPLLLWARKKILNTRIEIKGFEQIEQCQKEGRPVILLTCHMLGLEYGALGLTQKSSSIGLINPARNSLFEWLITRGRTRFNGALFTRSQGLRPVIRAIKDDRIFYYLPDEDLGDKAQLKFVPFFGIETATITALSRIVNMTGAAVLPAVTLLNEQTGCYTLEIGKPLDNFPVSRNKSGELDDAKRMNQVLEELILRDPTQYMWSLRLFQTRPEGAPSPYQY